MTSQNTGVKSKGSSTAIVDRNIKVNQIDLMKEQNRNQINCNNILLLNRTAIASERNVKRSNLIHIASATSLAAPAKNKLSNYLQGQGEKRSGSQEEKQTERVEKSHHELSEKSWNAVGAKNDNFAKGETPLFHIFDGNIVISQELSQVQNLLFQINSKLQDSNNVNSADFPNTTFSKEEHSDVEIILEDKKTHQVLPCEEGSTEDAEKWTDQGTASSNSTKFIVKPLSITADEIGKASNRSSVKKGANLFISFNTFENLNSKTNLHSNGFEHDYTAFGKFHSDEKEVEKKGKHLGVKRVIVEKAEAELMQIEVIDGEGGQPTSSVAKSAEPIKLPDNLESVPKAEHFPTQRHRWNTNEEIAAILISFDKHNEWQSKEVIIRPKSGSMLLYSRKKVRYRRDGYCWKKRKDGKTTREDHMKLKVQGTECIYGCYVHSAILPTFHRRCYWLLQNPDIVLVHYLNVPYPDDNKLAVLAPSLALWGDKKEWTKEELVNQLKPMFYSEEERDLSNELEISTAETVEVIVTQLMEKQRVARAATLTKQLECGCPDSTCADGKTCSHPMRRITAANVKQDTNSKFGQFDGNNQVSSTTGSGMLLSKLGNNESHSTPIHSRSQRNDRSITHGTQAHPSSLVLSVSQIHSGGNLSLSHIQDGTNLLILNNPSSNANSSHPHTPAVTMVANFKCASGTATTASHHQPPLKQYHHPRNKIILKHEPASGNRLSCCRLPEESVTEACRANGEQTTPYATSGFPIAKPVDQDLNSGPPGSPAKAMDTCENSNDAILILNPANENRVNALPSVVAGSSFYHETLDLSQEDIQRTLSANMPMANFTSNGENTQKSSSPDNAMASSEVMVPEINPMELMDSPPAVVDDDVFVNLDAFDILSDFPELEVLDTSGNNSGATNGAMIQRNDDGRVNRSTDEGANGTVIKNESSATNVLPEFRETSASITDFSPEWAYPEGGVKVLVTGPWYSSSSRYAVLFDSFPVPTTLVQTGVLRCFCPAHEVGLAMVQVACDGFIISNSVMFEYKRPPQEELVKLKEPKIEENENLLKFTLLQRLEAVDGRLYIKEEPDSGDVSDSMGTYHQSVDFEERMVNYCQGMTNKKWKTDEEPLSVWTCGLRGMTLLHLAASLGYARLVCAMLHWRAENSSLLLETEVDALSQDDEGFTPLMRACGRGHRETALVLYRWNHTALHIQNSMQQTALSYARANGQMVLAEEIESLEASREEANMSLLSHTSNNLERLSESDVASDESPSSSTISLSSSKSLDAVFLRPDRAMKSETSLKPFFAESGSDSSDRSKTPSPTPISCESHRLIKRPSVDSGINLESHQSDNFSLALSGGKFKIGDKVEASKLSRCDRSMSLPSPEIFNSYESDGRRMDFALCEITGAGPSSQKAVISPGDHSEDETYENGDQVGEQEVRVLTLAEQIIAAIPERIKNESEEMELDDCPPNDLSSSGENLSDPLMESFIKEPSSSYHPSEFNFEFSDHSYRYYDMRTPSSSLSPASSSLQSPSPRFPIESPSPPPSTQDFCEFFQASGSIFEKDFSNLTLSDREQRELYQAAKIIQKAYRSYKGRKKLAEDKERAAAVLIQNYYRRYKQYAYFKQMTHAATVIQNGYRSYCEHKRFKKSQEAAVCIQNYYRHYKDQGDAKRTSREGTPSTGLKRTYSQRRQYQAACKIQQFMRQSKNKLQRERILAAEKGKPGVQQSSQDAPPKSQYRGNSDPNNRAHDADGGKEDA